MFVEAIRAMENRRIISVDNSAKVRAYLRSVLTPYCAKFVEADCLAVARNQLETGHDFQLLLLDLHLPDGNGMDFLRELRRSDSDLTIVVLTGQGDIKSASEAVAAGADGYMEKRHFDDLDVSTDLFYALSQALDTRAGIIAKKQLDQLKADFYSMVTHDLRNPTTSILIAIAGLQTGAVGNLTEQQQRYLKIADQAADKMLALINEYLDFAKIDAGYLRLSKSQCDLKSIIETSLAPAELQAESKQQKLVADLPTNPVLMLLDGERVQQVIENLLSNAIKYTPQNGQITLSLTSDVAAAIITITDTGRGISPGQIDKLFSKYTRLEADKSGGIKGTGLGLVIAREIVEAHDGEVRVESAGAGLGSTFTVRLPR